MPANHKLTALLQGRTATQIERLGATAVVHFDDGSVMTVQTMDAGREAAGASSTAAASGAPGGAAGGADPLGRVRGARQQGTTLQLDFDDESTLTLRTAEPTSSVLVRARDHTLEYAD